MRRVVRLNERCNQMQRHLQPLADYVGRHVWRNDASCMDIDW